MPEMANKKDCNTSWLVKDIKRGNADIRITSHFLTTPFVVSKCAIKIGFLMYDLL